MFTLTVFRDFGWIYIVCFYCFCMDLAVLLLYRFVAVKNTFGSGKPKFRNKRNLFIDGEIKCCLRKNILAASRKFCKETLHINVSFIVSFVVKKSLAKIKVEIKKFCWWPLATSLYFFSGHWPLAGKSKRKIKFSFL